MTQQFDVIIIGGGISGLYILDQLKEQHLNLNILLLERNYSTGGRIKTQYFQNGSFQFETGPWRFNNNHHNLKSLINQYHLEYQINSSSSQESTVFTIPSENQNTSTKKKKKTLKSTPGLSYFDNITYQENINIANQTNQLYKVPPIMDSTTSVYDISKREGKTYYVLLKGFSKLIELLETKHSKNIKVNCMVTDVKIDQDQIYQVLFSERNKNQYTSKKISAKNIILCIPPKDLVNWSISQKFLLPLLYSVNSIPLHHIYGYCQDLNKFYNNRFYITTESPLSQIISGEFDNNWFQVSYSGGERAQYWNRLKMTKPEIILDQLNYQLKQLNLNIKISQYQSFYWENAIHYWIPNFKFDLKKNVANSINPDPVNLPKLFCAGEAFSSYQGWIEGALETSKLVINNFNNIQSNKYLFHQVNIPKNFQYVIIDNRILDVKKWKQVHPGSKQAIENHLNEDISQLFRFINHKNYSWAIVYNIQKYWFKNGKIGLFYS